MDMGAIRVSRKVHNQSEVSAIMTTEQIKTDGGSIPKLDHISISSFDLRIPFQTLAVTTATAQISSLVFCLAWSVKFNFYESTATHCRVHNFLPSLSATLDFTPQRDVWRTCIGLSGVPRYLIAYMYYHNIYQSRPLLWLHCIEITALMGLSIVDSIRYFGKYWTVYASIWPSKFHDSKTNR